jgi:steroid 5-alpha reductase family enzyme
MSWWVLFAIAWAALAAIMALLWWRQRATSNAGTVDIAWSFGTGLVGVWFALAPLATPSVAWRQWLVAAFAFAWSFRLGLHVWQRVRTETEDSRYQELRTAWGDALQRKLFWFFQFQALFAVIFALPMLVAARQPDQSFRAFDLVAIVVFAAAVLGESLADRQLVRFKADPGNRGKVCDVGLWRYSRHPNYFFEWVHWFAYLFLAVDLTGAYPWGWVAALGPILMWVTVNKMTGIPPTEKHLLKSRGDAYRRYQATTNAFFPGPRRASAK